MLEFVTPIVKYLSSKVIYPEMMGYLTCVLMMSSFLIQVQSLNNTDVKLQNASTPIKTNASEKLTPPDKVTTHAPSENNITSTSSGTEPFMSFPKNLSTGALLRGFYVFVGLGAIVVIYIAVRTIRVQKKRKTLRKYGILANREDVEMTPLGEEEEDEEESTLFDMTAHNSHT